MDTAVALTNLCRCGRAARPKVIMARIAKDRSDAMCPDRTHKPVATRNGRMQGSARSLDFGSALTKRSEIKRSKH